MNPTNSPKISKKERDIQFALGSLPVLKERYTRRELWAYFRKSIHNDTSRILSIELFEKQKQIIFSNHKTKIVRAARRTAKSFNSAFITYSLLRFASMFNYTLHIKYAGPRAEDTRHIWEHLHNFLDVCPIPNFEIIYDNWHNKSTNKKEMKFSNGTWIKSASCDSPEMNDIRGNWHDLLIVDEYGQIKYQDAFLEAALYSLKDNDPLNQLMIVGTFDVVGTGKGFNKLFDLGQEGRTDIKSWTLKGSDNPYSDQEATQSAKDIVSEEGYLREEMGEGIPQFGRMFKDFNVKTQIKDLTYDPNHPILIGVDFGYRKPIVLFGQFINGRVYIIEELSPKDILIDGLIQDISATLLGKFDNTTPLLLGCDPAGDKVNDVVSYNSFNKLEQSFPMATYTRNTQLVSKSNQVMLIKALTMQNKIFVNTSCEALIRSFAMASPDVTRTGAVNSAGWKKEGGEDDPLDALAYLLINYGPTSELIVPQEKEVHATIADRNAAMSAFSGF